MRKSRVLRFSSFSVNMETSGPTHGPPRGLINRMVGLGLPPWAAWARSMTNHSVYRMSGSKTRHLRPKYPQEQDEIWMNENVRERVRTSRSVQHVYRQLKYPWMRTGIWHSDLLDHWVQIPMVQAASYAIERDGGFDNFILNRPGQELRSRYGERIRRHLLVRKKEVEKNFVLEEHATALSKQILVELQSAQDKEELRGVIKKYGLKNFLSQVARVV